MMLGNVLWEETAKCTTEASRIEIRESSQEVELSKVV